MPDSSWMTAFVCANCARPGRKPTSAGRERPVVPDFDWPVRAQQIIIPCAGRLQPEHVLKAFESGSSVVSVVACREDNCHYIEGSRRCALRVEYVQSILKEIGLGEGRLLLSHLPGSAFEDMALAGGDHTPPVQGDSLETQITAIRDRATEALQTHPPNPLQGLSQDMPVGDSSEEEMSYSEVGSDE